MRKVKKSGSFALLLVSLAWLLVSCGRDDPPMDYTSIAGIYTCHESSPHAGFRQYPVEINKVHDTENRYIIVNFHNKGQSEFIFGELDQDSLHIRNQAISDISVNGNGLVNSNFSSIQLNYVTDDGLTILDYYTTYKR